MVAILLVINFIIYFILNKQNSNVYEESMELFVKIKWFICFNCNSNNFSIYCTFIMYLTKAKRPFSSKMSKEKLKNNNFRTLRSWKSAVKDYIENIK